ncbi:unnamed protein product, partial [Heterotrigona itama]
MNLLNVQNEFRNKGRFQFAAVVLRETDGNYMNSFSSINKELRKGKKKRGTLFRRVAKIAIPDLNSIRIPSGVLEADLLHKPRTMDAHVHRCMESKKGRGTNPTSCKIKSQFVLPKVGCDLRVGSNKNTDPCGVCGGNGSSCQSRYSWSLESISACSKSCGG